MADNSGQNLLKSTFDDLISINRWTYFLLLCLLTATLLFIKKSFVESQITAFIILEEKGKMGLFHIFDGLQYLSIPLFYLWKFTITSFVLWVGSFMFGYKISYQKMWQLVLIGETLFLIPDLLKTLWFVLVETNPDYWDIKAFYPLSLMHFFDYELIARKWHYPLKAVNAFEVIYWFVLVAFIHFSTKKDLKISFLIVGTSYVLFFILWLVFYVMAYK